MASYFGRVNYNFREKIMVTATARTDGSSRFGADNKYAFFPSAAVAWIELECVIGLSSSPGALCHPGQKLQSRDGAEACTGGGATCGDLGLMS